MKKKKEPYDDEIIDHEKEADLLMSVTRLSKDLLLPMGIVMKTQA